jgi:hypothetical protein
MGVTSSTRGLQNHDRLITMRRAAIFAIVFLLAPAGQAQNDWQAYGHDHGNTHFSPLKQISPANVTRLHRACPPTLFNPPEKYINFGISAYRARQILEDPVSGWTARIAGEFS